MIRDRLLEMDSFDLCRMFMSLFPYMNMTEVVKRAHIGADLYFTSLGFQLSNEQYAAIVTSICEHLGEV